MKTRSELQNKLNELIEFARAETAQDHANLGAMLVSCGSAFCRHGGVERDDMIKMLDIGINAERGLPGQGQPS